MAYRIVKYGKYWRIINLETGRWNYKKFSNRESAKYYLYKVIYKI